jgi:hypothetical protein
MMQENYALADFQQIGKLLRDLRLRAERRRYGTTA